MSIIAWILLGFLAGIIANSLLDGKAKHSVVVTAVIGIAGALLGGWAASAVFGIAVTGDFFDLPTWLIAILGSAVLLLIYHLATGGSRRRGFRRARR